MYLFYYTQFKLNFFRKTWQHIDTKTWSTQSVCIYIYTPIGTGVLYCWTNTYY